MRTLTSVVSVLFLGLAIGCSGGGDGGGGGGGGVDAGGGGGAADAAPSAPDAGSTTVVDGKACTRTQEDPTGGCGTGYLCLQSGCAEECNLTTTPPIQADQAACPLYNGPGVSLCLSSISTMQGQPPTAAACIITCEDSTGNTPGCTGAACDGTCPNALSCKQHPNPEAPAGLKVCQP